METVSDLERILAQLVNVLVDLPEAARVSTVQDDSGILFLIKVSKQDMGKIIGKDGRTARALPLLFQAVGIKLKTRISLDISDSEN